MRILTADTARSMPGITQPAAEPDNSRPASGLVHLAASRWAAPLIFGAVGLLSGASTQAASFDCENAATVDEKTICADETLSLLDRRLTDAYQALLAAGDKKKAAAISTGKKCRSIK